MNINIHANTSILSGGKRLYTVFCADENGMTYYHATIKEGGEKCRFYTHFKGDAISERIKRKLSKALRLYRSKEEKK